MFLNCSAHRIGAPGTSVNSYSFCFAFSLTLPLSSAIDAVPDSLSWVMDLGPFVFEATATGLASSVTHGIKRLWMAETETFNEWNPPRWIAKQEGNEYFNPEGEAVSQSAPSIASTWQTSSAFTGRCGIVRTNAVAGAILAGSDELVASNSFVVPRWLSRRPVDYSKWSVEFYLRSNAAMPSILLSVGPYYFPYCCSLDLVPKNRQSIQPYEPLPSTEEGRHSHTHRVLQTPLIWEEPHTFSVEANAKGLYLWSDQWETYGKKISETGMHSAEDLKGFGKIGSILHADINFETMPELAVAPAFECYLRLDWESSETVLPNGTRAARLTISTGELDEKKSGLHNVIIEPSNEPSVTNYVSEDISLATSSTTVQRRVLPTLAVKWSAVSTEQLVIEPEARDAFFTPYLTLLSEGDEGAVIGGSLGPQRKA